MATSYTSLLGFALPVTGELQGTWGDTVNNSITQLCEDSIAGVATASVTSADWTLTTTGSGAANQARMAILIPTGTPGVSRNIIAPSKSKTYTVINQSNAAVVLKGAATTGVTIAAGDKVVVVWNGSDFVSLVTTNAAGVFTTLSASSTVSGVGFSNYMASPPAIGSTTASTGAFTTLSASSTVTLSGGTANGVAYLNASKVLTSGSGLVFDGSNLGLGVTPSAWGGYTVFQNKAVSLASAANVVGFLSGNAYSDGTWKYVNTGAACQYAINNGGQHQWYTAPSGTAGNAIAFTQAMTLDASGHLLVGTSTAPTADTALALTRGTATNWMVGPSITNGNGANFFIVDSASAGVYLLSGSTAWSANSDERLKTDLKPIENAAQKVSTLRAVTGRFKTDEKGVSRSFLIAQDVQAVLPEAVNVQTDEIGTLGVQYTDTIPLLVAAIKELTARITTLEAK